MFCLKLFIFFAILTFSKFNTKRTYSGKGPFWRKTIFFTYQKKALNKLNRKEMNF